MDYSKLSKEELIALLENRDAELYQTRKERDDALKKLEEVIEKKNVSRAKIFARKSEIRKNTFNEAEETKEKEDNSSNKKGRKVGSKNFDYAYAITAWKAQGSQYNKILIYEEDYPQNEDMHKRVMYTAITRAVDKVVIVR